jgi:general secretion pathway protein G
MIELIFVIVILGILAAVAIPRLAATRDDAEVTRALANFATVINDFGSYYTSQGVFAPVSTMTNVINFDNTGTNLNVDQAVATFRVRSGNNAIDCISITSTPATGTITFANVGAANDEVCRQVTLDPKVAGYLVAPARLTFGGSNVVR